MSQPSSLKRMMNALSFAHLGESLSLSQKDRALSASTATTVLVEAAADTQASANAVPRSQVGLYLGSELPASVMQYVLQTCVRLHHGLTVFSFQSEREIDATLAPHRHALAEANVIVKTVALTGDPARALASALKRRSGVAFLVCNESGFLGSRLTRGAISPDSLPVPVVLVAARGEAVEHRGAMLPGATRAA
ncbi:MAG: hypothetical protein ACK4R8_07865 [Thiobacillus sp.]